MKISRLLLLIPLLWAGFPPPGPSVDRYAARNTVQGPAATESDPEGANVASGTDVVPETMLPPARTDPVPVVDHHLHITSEAVIEVLKNLTGETALSVFTVDDAIRGLDEAGIRRGVLLSLGYIFAAPYFYFDDERQRVMAENDFNAEQAARYPERLIAFCGMNPLSDYALAELERCAEHPGITGVKLHFANSHINLLQEEHFAAVAAFFEEANRLRVPLVVHLASRDPDQSRRIAETFVTGILPLAGNIPVQIAHLAGMALFTDASMAAMTVYRDALQAGHPHVGNLYFDMSGALQDPRLYEDEGDEAAADSLRRANLRALGMIRSIEQVSPGRILFASDWVGELTRLETGLGDHHPDSYIRFIRGHEGADFSTGFFENRAGYLESPPD